MSDNSRSFISILSRNVCSIGRQHCICYSNTNDAGNGGAINSSEDSYVQVEYTSFSNNEALNGGAIIARGDLVVESSWFFDNFAFNGVRIYTKRL